MYRARDKRKQTVRLVITYTIMASAVVLLVGFLLLIMLGYRFNRADGRVEQGGLVQFNSRPSGADIIIDGEKQPFGTSAKATMVAGEHTVAMQKNGYHDWSKNFTVEPGRVLWLNYARFIPKNIAIETIGSYKSVNSSIMSRGKYIALLEDAVKPVFLLYELEDNIKTPKKITLPAAKLAKAIKHTYTLRGFDKNAEYVLIEHTYDKKTEWLLSQISNPVNTKNITQLAGFPIEKVNFVLDSHDEFYAIENNNLRRINVENGTISRPLVQNVAKYRQYNENIITYVTKLNTNDERSIGYYTKGAKKARKINAYSYSKTATIDFAIGEYYQEKYLAVLRGSVLEVLTGALPSSDSDEVVTYKPVVTTTIPNGADRVTFSPGSRFIVAQDNAKIYSYDLELGKTAEFTFSGKAKSLGAFQWADDTTLTSTRDNIVRFYEFDGQNSHEIMNGLYGQAMGFGEAGKFYYSISKTKDGKKTVLQRAQMVLN